MIRKEEIQPIYLQSDCVNCIYYDGFGCCTEKGYDLKENCELYKEEKL